MRRINKAARFSHSLSVSRRFFTSSSLRFSDSSTPSDAPTSLTAPLSTTPIIHVLRLPRLPILTQLRLEEALLRADDRNWCILNQPACNPYHLPEPVVDLSSPPAHTTRPDASIRSRPDPLANRAIVLGISGNPHKLVHLPAAERDGITLIKRFSGGGTVFVDHHTKFVTFIINSDAANTKPYPRPIMKWTEFVLREDDYCIDQRKCGGNAQSIVKDRWLHHTSFLWDYDENNFKTYLKMPDKMPHYRSSRKHEDFLVRLKTEPQFSIPFSPSSPSVSPPLLSPFHHDTRFDDEVVAALHRFFVVRHEVTYEQLLPVLQREHNKSTVVLEYDKIWAGVSKI